MVLSLALAAFIAPAEAQRAASESGNIASQLYAVASARMMTSVNRNDALAAIKAWFEVLGKDRGFLLDTKIEVLPSHVEILRRLREASVHILILDIGDFLRLEATGLVEPALLGNRSEKTGPRSSYVLLARSSAAGEGLAGLRGKTLSFYSRGESNTGLMWLDLALEEQRLGRVATFFGSAKRAEKPQECVLGLFFGKVDACLVDETNLELMKEMNPQLGQLRTLAKSAQLVEMVIAIPVVRHPHQEELLEAALELHQSARGKQILMVFKTSKLVRASRADFDAVRALWAAHSRLRGEPPQAVPAQPGRTLDAGVAASGKD